MDACLVSTCGALDRCGNVFLKGYERCAMTIGGCCAAGEKRCYMATCFQWFVNLVAIGLLPAGIVILVVTEDDPPGNQKAGYFLLGIILLVIGFVDCTVLCVKLRQRYNRITNANPQNETYIVSCISV